MKKALFVLTIALALLMTSCGNPGATQSKTAISSAATQTTTVEPTGTTQSNAAVSSAAIVDAITSKPNEELTKPKNTDITAVSINQVGLKCTIALGLSKDAVDKLLGAPVSAETHYSLSYVNNNMPADLVKSLTGKYYYESANIMAEYTANVLTYIVVPSGANWYTKDIMTVGYPKSMVEHNRGLAIKDGTNINYIDEYIFDIEFTKQGAWVVNQTLAKVKDDSEYLDLYIYDKDFNSLTSKSDPNAKYMVYFAYGYDKITVTSIFIRQLQ